MPWQPEQVSRVASHRVCVRAAPPTPASRTTLSMSVHQVVLGGLRLISRRLGARIDTFEACSGFTRVAARTLADPPEAGLCPRSFDGPVTLPSPG